ncbi:hypothetical protein FNF29_03396 [Cafeteria roenbergensis]|uniref:Phosphoglycolate phosphatase n=1 Tax=Cafeteria roenbergensis TaxID=33653 RepID=A0A5A8CK79_CAFRO|nr:hypothetical protein FNF29_03396 [Cafeteria roenbergensis]|eukprot:KAA0153208.1 hypothetical protein FNF29_03396 [Cafeteria roenbergensis]
MAAATAARSVRRSATRLASSDVATFRSWLDGVDAVLLDCDGVIWRGTTPIPGALAAIDALRAAGKRVVFVSNNSTKSRATYVGKLKRVCGIESTVDDVMSSAFAAASLLASKKLAPAEGHDQVGVFVVGESGLHEELRAQGFRTIGQDEGGGKPFDFAGFDVASLDGGVRAVVQGFDTEFSYNKLALAASYIRYARAEYVATNTDETFPAHGFVVPGGGSMVAALRTGCGVEPEVAGKPSPRLMDLIAAHIGVPASRCAMVGDRLNTDIRFGNSTGAQTALVLTGVTTAAQAEASKGPERPDIVLDSIADVTALLAAASE